MISAWIKLNHQETAGFRPCVQFPGVHFGYPFLTHRDMVRPSWDFEGVISTNLEVAALLFLETFQALPRDSKL